MLMGAPISMTPNKGPFDVYFADPDDEVILKERELIVVLVLKIYAAFEWTTVLAVVVRVYNDLDPDAAAFRPDGLSTASSRSSKSPRSDAKSCAAISLSVPRKRRPTHASGS